MVWPLRKTLWKFLVKSNIYLAYCPVIPVLHIYPREMKMCPHKDLCMNGRSRFVYNSLKPETTQMSINRRMDTQIVINPQTKYYSTVQRNEVLVDTIWINLKITMLSERSQTQKSIYCLIQFIWNCRKGKTNPQIESRSVITWGWGLGKRIDGRGSQGKFGRGWWKYSFLDCNGDYMTIDLSKLIEFYTLNWCFCWI